MRLAMLKAEAAHLDTEAFSHSVICASIAEQITNLTNYLEQEAAQQDDRNYLNELPSSKKPYTSNEMKDTRPKKTKPGPEDQVPKGESSSTHAAPAKSGLTKAKTKAAALKLKTCSNKETNKVKEKAKTPPTSSSGGAKGKGK